MLLRLVIFLFLFSFSFAQKQYAVKIARLKYPGGGDWYANPTSLPNLLRFVRKNTTLNIAPQEDVVEANSYEIFEYPIVYLTGHGNMEFSPEEINILRDYLLGGGFLFMDDNYGLHKFAMREMKKIFPKITPVSLPVSHPLFYQVFSFPQGLPKIHEHDGKPAQLFGWFVNNRLVAVLTYEADLGDGWEDPIVHNDPEPIRQKALKIGTNILYYVFTH